MECTLTASDGNARTCFMGGWRRRVIAAPWFLSPLTGPWSRRVQSVGRTVRSGRGRPRCMCVWRELGAAGPQTRTRVSGASNPSQPRHAGRCRHGARVRCGARVGARGVPA
eukprot:6857973-Prymnesium_polylepis.1